MYKSPIEMVSQIINDFNREIVKIEEEVAMRAVCDVGISVNKDDLIRALQYDRNQYEAGVIDGLKLADEAIMRFLHSNETANEQDKNGLFVASEIIDCELRKRDRS